MNNNNFNNDEEELEEMEKEIEDLYDKSMDDKLNDAIIFSNFYDIDDEENEDPDSCMHEDKEFNFSPKIIDTELLSEEEIEELLGDN